MKKLLIFAVMATMGLSAQAQLMRSTTFYKKERVSIPATWYLRAGLSVNNVAGANELLIIEKGEASVRSSDTILQLDSKSRFKTVDSIGAWNSDWERAARKTSVPAKHTH